jgi:hypothetical protein
MCNLCVVLYDFGMLWSVMSIEIIRNLISAYMIKEEIHKYMYVYVNIQVVS